MVHHAKSLLRRALGVLLVLVGIVGLLMPIMPGWLFLVPGGVLLGFDIPKLVSLLRHLQHHHPRFGGLLGWASRKLHRYHTGESSEPPANQPPR
jgi:uncharacterized membrane protein YbaN (DUF454 family)